MQAASLMLQMPRLVHKHLDFFPGSTASLWKSSSRGGKNSNHLASNMVSGVTNPWDNTALCSQDSCALEVTKIMYVLNTY